MQFFGFLLFLVASHIGVMQIFRLTTYHRYFWPALPLLLGYAAFVGWALFSLNMHTFFLWQLVCASAWLFIVGRGQRKAAAAMLELAGNDADAVRFVALSAAKTLTYYNASSAVYVACFAITYLWLYNATM